jgi:Flp pilus assembly protein TadD
MLKSLPAAVRGSLPGGVLLLGALLAAYANHFHNSFHFDDAHTIVNNAAIQELRNIPLFFCDATTFSALPSNQSYRPLVSTLLAFSYWLGRGLQPFWFHFFIFAAFAALVVLFWYFLERLVEDRPGSSRNRWIALSAAAVYGLHPANADTVNYIIASADVLSTLGVVASFALYLGFPSLRRYYIYTLPAALAILAKPPAAVFAVLFALYRLMFSPSNRDTLRRSAAAKAWFVDVVPPLLICAAVLLFVQHMTPRTWVAGAADAHRYLITQPYVAWLYFKTFFWPNTLSADYDLNAFTTTDDARFWAGFIFAFLLIAVAVILGLFKRARLIAFGLLWFLIALLPTSLLPLAEVMNDHRTFMPYIGLVIALAGAAALIWDVVAERASWVGIVAGGVIAFILCGSGYATFQRNKVWKTEETLWHDVTLKSSQNGRGLMNYGNTLMARADYTGALDYFHRALVLAPQYPILFINLAIAEDAIGQDAMAEQHFQEALRLAPSTPDSYTYYARTLMAHGRKAEARALLGTALLLSPGDVTAHELLAKIETESAASVQSTTAPLTPESYLQSSLQFYQQGRFAECIEASQKALALRPGYAEAWNNIGAAYNKLGQFAQGADACEKALRLKPDFELARNNLSVAREKMAGPAPRK